MAGDAETPRAHGAGTPGEEASATTVDIVLDRPEPHATPLDGRGGARLLNRELSWVDYNDRVLSLAGDPALPPLERARFAAIASRALDEFFQVRVGGLRQQVEAGLETVTADGLSAGEQLDALRPRIEALYRRQATIFLDGIATALQGAGIRFSDWESLDDEDRAHLDRVFEDRIFPVLTPLAVDPAHPFPYISSLSLNLIVVVTGPHGGEQHIARLKVPPLLSRFVVLPDGERFVPIEQVIAAHLGRLFPGMRVVAHHVFRVTRNADYELDEDEAEDLMEAVQAVLQQRRRSPLVVRLEVDASTPDQLVELLVRELAITRDAVYRVEGPLDLGGLFDISRLDRPDLRYPSWTPVTPPRLQAAAGERADIFTRVRDEQVLLHHPYDSFETSVEAFISQAAEDPRVLAIKQTLYRTAGSTSGIIAALTRAAEAGKQVVALIELTARFDEQNNINWAQLLEQSGVHVVYGKVGLKTHAKVTLVVREEKGGIRRYCHVATGNYNRDTARGYEDIGVLSSDALLGADVGDLFNSLTGYSRQRRYRKILVAPDSMRTGILNLIRREGDRGREGRIVIKVNNLVDAEICEALYAASRQGCEIDLIVRSICCLRPGVPGLSESIRVRSLVGRYLEHSRILRFGADAYDADYYISSADLMPRNLDRRVEVALPIRSADLRARLQEVLDTALEDDVNAWTLDADTHWRRVPTVAGSDAQTRMQELARERSRSEPADALP